MIKISDITMPSNNKKGVMIMKIIRMLTVLLAVLLGLVSLTGCQEETKLRNNKRARLIFDENLKLKKQVQILDTQIQEQKDLLAACEKEKAEIQKYMEDFTREQLNDPVLMKIIRETGKQLEDVTIENEQLKGRIKELEAKLAQNSNQQDSP